MGAKQIMLVCSAGMSTSLMVNKMKAVAADKGLDAEIFAVPIHEAEEYLKDHDIDVLLLGPQVRYLLDNFKGILASRNVPVDVIPMTDYGLMKGDKVLAQAEALMQ